MRLLKIPSCQLQNVKTWAKSQNVFTFTQNNHKTVY